ncbi:hypothetical protein EYV94_08690 [Puteibacter caeruleilacunae]|nr:hypothetical protein EYV94_08690 [Puteibacter caeruleilacunae]
MGIYKHGPFSGVSGKVGNLVGGSWMGKDYWRIIPAKVKNPRTPDQQAQRNRLGCSSKLATYLNDMITKDIFNAYVEEKQLSMLGRNLFIRHNIHALEQDGSISDYSMLKLSVGSLSLPFDITIDRDPNHEKTIRMQWRNWNPMIKTRSDDELYFIVAIHNDGYEDDFNIFKSTAIRNDGIAYQQLPFDEGTEMHIYAYFSGLNRDHRQCFTDSFYSKVIQS